jgi:protein O-mannosyl-transferase
MSKRNKSTKNNASQARLGTSVSPASPLGILAGATLIVAVVFLAYFPSLSGGFILDDVGLVANNDQVKASDGLYRFWCTTEAIDYWPVTNTTFWIEWHLWGVNPTGSHITNLILHIVESLLIWIILRKLSIPGAFLAAMIFAVHPVNVESVAWIAQRKNMVAMLFFLLSILWYLEHLRSMHTQDVVPDYAVRGPLFGRWYWLSIAAFVLAMLSKGSVAVLPVLLLGIVWWMRPGGTVPISVSTKMALSPSLRRDLVRTAPFFAVAVILTLVNVWFQTHGTGEECRSASFAVRLIGAGGVVWFYLYKALLPFDLAFVYPQWDIQADNPLWWLPLLAALAVTAVLWRYRTSWSRPLFFAWGFFCAALAPVMGFIDVGFMRYSLVADHYQHIAIIGAIVPVAAGFYIWRQRARGGALGAATVAGLAAIGALTTLTWRQSGIYHDGMTLYQATLDKNPECYMAYDNLGCILLDTGRPQEAIKQFERALRIKSDYIEAHNDLGEALFKIGRHQEAIDHFKKAIQIRPDKILAYNNLAVAYSNMHRSSEAVDAAQKALNIARSKGLTALAKKIEDWLNTYRASLSDQNNTLPPSKPAPTPP